MRFAPIVGFLLALLISAAVWIQRTHNVNLQWESVEFALLDWSFQLRGEVPVGDEVVVIAIDDQSIADHPHIYERRAGMAGLLDKLAVLEPKAVAIDFIFQQPEFLLPEPLTKRVQDWYASPHEGVDNLTSELLEDIHTETLGDETMAKAIGQQPTVLGFHMGQEGNTNTDDRTLNRGAYGQVVAGDFMAKTATAALTSLTTYNKKAKRLAELSVVHDHGTTSRQIPLATRIDSRHFIPLGVQLAAIELDVNRALMVYRGDLDAIELDERRVPSDRGAIWLNWRGLNAFDVISAGDVMDGRGKDLIEGRIAVVAMYQLFADTIETPFGEQQGVQSHLTLMDNILHGDWLERASPNVEAAFTLGMGMLTVLLFLVPGVRAPHVIGLGVLGAATVVFPIWLHGAHAIWLGSVGAKLAVFVPGLAAMITAWVQEGAKARALRGAFAQYVSPDLLKVIANDPTLVSLQGQRRELSILFSDIRDFTSHSERMDPLELVGFLNDYLTPMTRAVLDNRGFVDKFIGDAVMALFGAPVPDPQHPEQAARAALAMYGALQDLIPVARAHNIELAIGIGINSGPVALGNLGSADRFEYTVLGDAVNLAARLEALTKNYGVFCLIGPNTAAALGSEFRLRTLDLVRVKGKHEPVEIFELTGDDSIQITWYEAIDLWNKGVQLWRSGDFPGARVQFSAFLEANPDDNPTKLYLARLDQRATAPDGWDGVFTHTTK